MKDIEEVEEKLYISNNLKINIYQLLVIDDVMMRQNNKL